MISSNIIFDSVRRGYNELEQSSNEEILNYFEDINPDAMVGHISNIKGIVFEQEVVNILNGQGLNSIVFKETNHPISDIAIMEDEDIILEVQLKATDSISYINETINNHPDIPIISTSEVANKIDLPVVINSGIDNSSLEMAVVETIEGEISDEVAKETIKEIGSSAGDEGFSEVIGLPITPLGIAISLLTGIF